MHKEGNFHLTSHTGINCVVIYFYLCEVWHGPKKGFSSDVSPKALCLRLLPPTGWLSESSPFFWSTFNSLFQPFFVRISFFVLARIRMDFFKLLLVKNYVSSLHLTTKPDWNGHLLNRDAMHCTTSSCAAPADSEAFLPPLLPPLPTSIIY